jgi:DNA-binding PadR family transcriptional regulator
MQLFKMPLFELFLPIIQSNSIHNWTANDFWKQMKLTKKERHRFNRQRMYRILRKLVEFGFLEKNVVKSNSRLSRFNETSKLNEFRVLEGESTAVTKMKLEEKKLNSEIIFLKKQIEKYLELEMTFPSMKNKIFHAKENCLSQLIEMQAYQSALKSVTL